MDQIQRLHEALDMYRKFGWRLKRVLLRPETLAQFRENTGGASDFEGVAVRESVVDAIWLARPSQGTREAWELRLIAEPPYALFELFEPDEEEEDREDVRREMEARLIDYAGGKKQEE